MIRITFSDYLSVCRVAGALSQDKLVAAVQEETRMIRITFSDYLCVQGGGRTVARQAGDGSPGGNPDG